MNPQLEGMDEIAGTYVFDVARSVQRLAINRFFWNMIRPEHRQQFLQDELASCEAAGLTAEESELAGDPMAWPLPVRPAAPVESEGPQLRHGPGLPAPCHRRRIVPGHDGGAGLRRSGRGRKFRAVA